MTSGSSIFRCPASCARAGLAFALAASTWTAGGCPSWGASPNVATHAPESASHSASPAADGPPRSTVARARILECGHQWNNMKRAGTATGTWKDFSRVCLAQR